MTPRCAVLLRTARLPDAPAMAGLSRALIEAGLVWHYTAPRMAALIRDPDTVALVACGASQTRPRTPPQTPPPTPPQPGLQTGPPTGLHTGPQTGLHIGPPTEPPVLGFAVMRFGDTQAHLALLCVQPQQRQQGIGRRLIDWLTASARVAGISMIGLELRADNAAALGFYRRLGFVETALVPGYYDSRIAARRMTLRLAATPR